MWHRKDGNMDYDPCILVEPLFVMIKKLHAHYEAINPNKSFIHNICFVPFHFCNLAFFYCAVISFFDYSKRDPQVAIFVDRQFYCQKYLYSYNSQFKS